MKPTINFNVRAHKPKDVKFGDFVVTNVNYSTKEATADFGGGAKAVIDVGPIINIIKNYHSRTKTFYVRAT